MSNYMETYKQWCTDPYFDADTKAELKKIEGDQAEIEDRFYRQLEFGTGGLRGVIGAGTNRMNIYTVRQATQGLANYIISPYVMVSSSFFTFSFNQCISLCSSL